MRLSTVIISSAFVLAGMSAALSTERENMLVARFVDSGFPAEFEARAYDDEPELYARGGALSSSTSRGRNRDRTDRIPQTRRTSSTDALLGNPRPKTTSRNTPDYRSSNGGRSRFGLGNSRGRSNYERM